MNYRGIIIEESLKNPSLVKELATQGLLSIANQEVEKVEEAHETPWLEQWTCDEVEISEDKIEEAVQLLSQSIDTEHIGNWYCDFKNTDIHYVVFSNKIFKINRKSREDYSAMREYALGIGLPEHQLPRYEGFDLQQLADFLIEAKKQTYASGDEAKTTSSREGSNDYHYESKLGDERIAYHDTYFGGVKFMGEEVVYLGEGAPKWGMNYRGETLRLDMSEAAMDAVLRPALSMVGEDKDIIPVRGPKYLEKDGFIYEFNIEGNLESFHGEEKLTKDGELIYRNVCDGGIIE
jgi:hypothetical protein